MDDFHIWADQNWFPLLQTVGILGGLFATYLSLLRDRKSWKLANYLTLVGQHRDLWRNVPSDPLLTRVLTPEVDLIGKPISLSEQEFLNLVIVHFHTGWIMAQEKMFLSLAALTADAASFFRLPLPKEVWKLNKAFHDPAFVEFIDNAARVPHAANR